MSRNVAMQSSEIDPEAPPDRGWRLNLLRPRGVSHTTSRPQAVATFLLHFGSGPTVTTQ